MNKFIKAGLISLLFAGQAAMADMYVGGGLYSSSIDEGSAFDDSDTTPAIFLGWKPMKFLAIEVGYYDLGDYSDGPLDADVEAYTLGVVGILPLAVVDLYAKAGFASMSVNGSGNAEWDNLDDTTDPYAGVGANINLGGSIDLYAEYLVFDGDLKVDTLGLGIRFQF